MKMYWCGINMSLMQVHMYPVQVGMYRLQCDARHKCHLQREAKHARNTHLTSCYLLTLFRHGNRGHYQPKHMIVSAFWVKDFLKKMASLGRPKRLRTFLMSYTTLYSCHNHLLHFHPVCC